MWAETSPAPEAGVGSQAPPPAALTPTKGASSPASTSSGGGSSVRERKKTADPVAALPTVPVGSYSGEDTSWLPWALVAVLAAALAASLLL